MEKDKHLFTMHIGDWSDDGHGKQEIFTIESNFPVERVREAHFRIKKYTGVDIEEICSDYDDSSVSDDVVERLKELGFEFECPGGTYASEMVELWLFLLQKVDPELKLKKAPSMPTLHFYGFDEKRRHIGFVGYGLFE